MKSRLLFTLCFLLTAWLVQANNQDYSKGWEAFANNNRTAARSHFEAAVANEPANKADALLSLCLLDWSEGKDQNAFNYFQQFYYESKHPYEYLEALFLLPFLYGQQVLSAAQLKFYESILNDPKMNGTMRATIYQHLGDHYQACNNRKKSEELYAKIGAVSRWQVLGSFENISSSGFTKDWGVIAKNQPEQVFKNKEEAEVTWFTPLAERPDRWFDFDYYFQLDDVILYAQTFLISPTEQEVIMRVGTSGSLKVWINDAEVMSIPEERNCGMDIYACKVRLNKGANRIVVQIGQSEISRANFLLRLTDENANPIQGLSNTPDYTAYTKAAASEQPELIPFFAEDFLEKQLQEQPDNMLNYLVLAELYLKNDKSYEATKVLKQIEAKAPQSSYIQYRLAEAYLRANNETDRGMAMENIKLDDPASFYALQQLFDEAIQSEKYSEAEAILQQVKNLYGESELTEGWEMGLASLQRRMNDLIAISKALYKKYPHRYEYMSYNYSILKNIQKDSKAATLLLEDYVKKYNSSRAIETLSDNYMEQGKTDKALKIWKQLVDDKPYSLGLLYNYASLLNKSQRYKEALEMTTRLKKLNPYLAGIYNMEGYIYMGMNNNDGAISAFRKSIYYNPRSYDSRSQLRMLENKKEIFDFFPKYNIDSIIMNAPKVADYPNDHSIILLDDNQLVYYPEGAQEHRYQILIKILNQSGIDTWKEYRIYYFNQRLLLDKYEVIKSNGKKVRAETDNRGTVVFTNLEIGDVLHLEYRLQDYVSGVFSKHFFGQNLFQSSVPMFNSRHAILAPADKVFDYKMTNGHIETVITELEGMKLYQWTSDYQPSIKYEPYMSSLIDIAPTLTFSSVPDWKFVSDWYKDLTSNKFKSDFVLKTTLAEILKGHDDKTDLEKAKLFYEYILKNISYSSVPFMQSNFIPQKASRTINTHLGDCKDVATLFVALCRESGIEANLALVSTRDNGRNHLLLPTNRFNHCIAGFKADDKTYYLELTDPYLPFEALPAVDVRAHILPIPYKDEQFENKIIILDSPLRETNKIKRSTRLTLNNNDLNVAAKVIRYGDMASYFRHGYLDIGQDEQLKQFTRAIAADYTVPVKISDLTFENLDNIADSVVYTYNLEVKGTVQDVAGMKIFQLPWSDKLASLSEMAMETRLYPLELWWYIGDDGNEEEIEIVLPKGKQWAEQMKDVHLQCANAVYSLTYDTRTPDVLKVKRSMQMITDLVMPEEYADFRNFLQAVSESDNKQYAIK